MAEFINREAFKKSVEERYCKPCKAEKKDHNGCWCRACWVDDMLDEVECFQPADVAPVRHGRWIEHKHFNHDHYIDSTYECSECNVEEPLTSDYCPNCGAKMDGGFDNG